MSQIYKSPPATPSVDSITGTDNQVLVNGTFGIAQTGPVTLTTPQDIAPTSDVTFNSIKTGNGTVNAPAWSFSDETDTGIFKIGPASQGFAFTGGGSLIGTFASGAIQFQKPLLLSSELALNYRATAISTAVLDDDCIIGVTSTASARTITLKTITDTGSMIVVKDESGGAATNNITVTVDGIITIDGATTFVMNTNFGSATFYFNGSNYFVM